MITYRRFRVVNFPYQIFSNCVICLERMGITLTKKQVLKEEGDDFEGILKGFQVSEKGQTIICLMIHGWRDVDHHGGLCPTSKTTDVIIETFEVLGSSKFPYNKNAKVLNDEFNKRLNLYVWHTSG